MRKKDWVALTIGGVLLAGGTTLSANLAMRPASDPGPVGAWWAALGMIVGALLLFAYVLGQIRLVKRQREWRQLRRDRRKSHKRDADAVGEATVQVSERADEEWRPPIHPGRLAEYLEDINRTMEEHGFGRNPSVPLESVAEVTEPTRPEFVATFEEDPSGLLLKLIGQAATAERPGLWSCKVASASGEWKARINKDTALAREAHSPPGEIVVRFPEDFADADTGSPPPGRYIAEWTQAVARPPSFTFGEVEIATVEFPYLTDGRVDIRNQSDATSKSRQKPVSKASLLKHEPGPHSPITTSAVSLLESWEKAAKGIFVPDEHALPSPDGLSIVLTLRVPEGFSGELVCVVTPPDGEVSYRARTHAYGFGSDPQLAYPAGFDGAPPAKPGRYRVKWLPKSSLSSIKIDPIEYRPMITAP